MARGDYSRRLLSALLGVSTYSRPDGGYGPDLDDPMVERIRESMGGQLQLIPTTHLRWYLADLEAAQALADSGDISLAAQLWRSMRRDGVVKGLMGTLTSGLVRLPKKFYGDEDTCTALQARNGSRSVFEDMFPPSELSLLAADGKALGVGVAELVPVEGRDFPVLVRLDPEFLRYRWNENRWYYMSIAGLLPITPGDGRWVLHTPGGRLAPWMSGDWPALGRSFINKEHALLHRSNYSAKLANPARIAEAPLGATEPQRIGMLSRLMAWGINTVLELPVGWGAKLLESNGRGIEVFQAEIDTCDREFAITLAGQVVTVDGGAGFQNSDIHRTIRADIVQDTADGLAYTLNTQGIPSWIAKRWGAGRIATGAILEWDVRRPKDQKDEAQAFLSLAQSIAQLQEVLLPTGRELDLSEILTRYEVPTRALGDGPGLAKTSPREPTRPKTLEARRALEAGGMLQ